VALRSRRRSKLRCPVPSPRGRSRPRLGRARVIAQRSQVGDGNPRAGQAAPDSQLHHRHHPTLAPVCHTIERRRPSKELPRPAAAPTPWTSSARRPKFGELHTPRHRLSGHGAWFSLSLPLDSLSASTKKTFLEDCKLPTADEIAQGVTGVWF
jgi:hypothetical protein